MLKWTHCVGATAGFAAALTVLAGVRTIYVADSGSTPVRGMTDGSSWGSAYDSLQDAIDDARAFGGPHQIRVAQGTYIPEFAPFTPDDDAPDVSGAGGEIPDGIEDHVEPGVAVFTVDVVAGSTIDGLELGLDLMHTWTGDLQITLRSPAGTTVEIMNRTGAGSPTSYGDASDLNGMYTFVDTGADFWAAADLATDVIPEGAYQASGNNFNGTFPVHLLDVFDGETSTGTWTLTIRDWAVADVGELFGWSMNFTVNEIQPPRGGLQQGPPRERRFAMYPDIQLLGGYRGPFDGTGKFSPDDRDPDEFLTVLDGRLDEPTPEAGINPSMRVYHVINASEADASSLLEGFSIINAQADGDEEYAYGGAVWVGGEGYLVMRRCVIEDNEASHGAGLFVAAEAGALVSNVRFSGNQADSLGGAVYNEGTGAFVNVTLNGNSAFDGGAIYNDGDALWANALIHDNSAAFTGGAILSTRGDLVVSNATVASNSAGTVGGIAVLGGTLALNNSIVWGNTDFFGDSFDAQVLLGAPFTATASIIQNAPEESPKDARGGAAIPGVSGADPDFVNEAGGDFRLGFKSAAIDAGDNEAIAMDVADLDEDLDVAEALPFDLDGNDRVIDAFGQTPVRGEVMAIVDLGAYEFLGIEERRCTADANGDDLVDFADLEMLLEQWNTPGPESDFDGNGLVDFADLNELLDNWGQGCGVLPD